MVPSFSFSGPHFERRRAERDPPGTYLEGKIKTTYSKTKVWYFVTKIVLTYCEKKLIFEITRTIYSNSERAEQFLVTECFLTCSWRFLTSNKLEQLEFKLEKKWDLETCRKS